MSKRKRKRKARKAAGDRMIAEMLLQLHQSFRKYEEIKTAAGLAPGSSLRIRLPVRYTVHN